MHSNKNYPYSEQHIFSHNKHSGVGADGPTVYFIFGPSPLKNEIISIFFIELKGSLDKIRKRENVLAISFGPKGA